MDESRDHGVAEEFVPRGVLTYQLALTPRKPGQGPISAEEVQAAYEAAFRIQGEGCLARVIGLVYQLRGVFQFADAFYQPVDQDLLQMILDADQGDKEEYVTEDYDCDDFAFNLMGVFHQNRQSAAWPIFITWILTPEGGHAVLSYYRDGQVWIIEPQTDEIFAVPDDWTLLLLCG